MSLLLVPIVEVDVPMNETRFSTTTIGTNYLGPCLAFLLQFKHNGEDICIITHYSFSITKEKENKFGLFGDLIRIIDYLVTEIQHCIPTLEFVSNGQQCLSDMYLLVAGGDSIDSSPVHRALSLLNRKLNYRIETICNDFDICFIYYELINRVTILKCVSKMLNSEEKDDDNDQKNIDKNDYPWSALGYTDTLGILNMNLLQTPSHIQWYLVQHNIKQFQSLCANDKELSKRLNELLKLIPEDDPLITSPYHLSDLKIGINGFSRIGQFVFQCALEQGLQIVGINDPFVRVDSIFQNDSKYGKIKGDVSYEDGKLVVAGQQIAIYTEREPSKIPWNQLDAEYVVESSGVFTTANECQPHIQAGAKKVIITESSADVPMFVIGVNWDKYTGKETVLSNASCTTNCVAPLAKVVHEKFGIVEGLMITVHSYAPIQEMLDDSSNKDSRSGRGTAQNMIASSTDAAEAIGKIIPDFNGKLTGMAVRVPTPNVAVVNLIVRLNKGAKYEEICTAIKNAANGPLRGILAYTDDEIVSTDFIGDKHSSIFDAKAGISFNDNFVKLVSWYKNEYGYSNRVIDFIKYVDLMKYLAKKD